ncbi:hypothetical protein J6590_012140 [Homalodisca vitripennis]|nr:hypothetical protein J6590_012140 [Homalodisca vitripennis]
MISEGVAEACCSRFCSLVQDQAMLHCLRLAQLSFIRQDHVISSFLLILHLFLCDYCNYVVINKEFGARTIAATQLLTSISTAFSPPGIA